MEQGNIPRPSTQRRPASAVVVLATLIGLTAAGCGGATRATVATPPPDPPPTAAAAIVYGGVWTGQSVPTQCRERGGAVGVGCASVPEAQRLRLRLAQAGSSASGVLELDGIEVAVSGTVAADGTLTLVGNHSAANHAVLIRGWRSSGDGQTMSGTFDYSIVPANEQLGTVTVTAVIEELARES